MNLSTRTGCFELLTPPTYSCIQQTVWFTLNEIYVKPAKAVSVSTISLMMLIPPPPRRQERRIKFRERLEIWWQFIRSILIQNVQNRTVQFINNTLLCYTVVLSNQRNNVTRVLYHNEWYYTLASQQKHVLHEHFDMLNPVCNHGIPKLLACESWHY